MTRHLLALLFIRNKVQQETAFAAVRWVPRDEPVINAGDGMLKHGFRFSGFANRTAVASVFKDTQLNLQ
jgi:hypothetical protein